MVVPAVFVTQMRWDNVTSLAPDGMSTKVPQGRYEKNLEHGWTYGHHPLQTPEQFDEMKAMLIEKRLAFAYDLKSVPRYCGSEGDRNVPDLPGPEQLSD